ncbi:MAG: hypothetical protein AAGI63_16415 [Planctomycetota bacterium]
MTSPLQSFLDQRPFFTQCVPTKVGELAIHFGVWRGSDFPDLDAFVTFAIRNSAILQPYIAEPDRHDLEKWIHFDPNSGDSAASFLNGAMPFESSAYDWLASNYPVIDRRFLNALSRDILIADGDTFYAQTDDWFIHCFVADLLFAPEPFPRLPGHSDEPWSADREFYEILGPESDSIKCKRENCDRGRIKNSVFCRPHHFENIKGRSSPYTH